MIHWPFHPHPLHTRNHDSWVAAVTLFLGRGTNGLWCRRGSLDDRLGLPVWTGAIALGLLKQIAISWVRNSNAWGRAFSYRKITIGCPRPMPTTAISMDEELAILAKALGHPARVRIIQFLAKRSSCMCGDIVDELPLAQSTVSQHLKVLKDAGLICGDVDGPRVCYCIEPSALKRLKTLITALPSPISSPHKVCRSA